MEETLTLEFDGGSRGNPGPAGIGVVVRAADGTPVVTLGRFIGSSTNNVAEYKALITALQKAKELGAKRVAVRGDSELVVKQMRGEYRVKNEGLKTLHEQARDLMAQFEHASIDHNYRNENALADKLANLAMDRKADVSDVNGDVRPGAKGADGDGSPSPLDAPSPAAPKAGDRFACPRCGCVIRIDKPTGVRPHQLKPFACQCGFKMQPVE